MNNIGAVIRKHRRLQGMRQSDLAEKVGVHGSYISHIETGRRAPNTLTLARIVNVLGCELDLRMENR